MNQAQHVSIEIGDKTLVLETGRMGKQANGAVFASYEGSAVLATVCCSDSPIEGLDYVPLQVEYNEKFYAAGKIPGGFIKREGRPKDKEILVSRLIDRPMRPLFSKLFKRDIQVIPTVVSADMVNPPDIIAMIASSAAVVISDIPFNGPIGAVRVASIDGELIVNPTFLEMENCELDIVVAGTAEGITMVEGGAKQVPEDLMISAIEKARGIIQDICMAQEKLREMAGKEKLPIPEETEEFRLKDEIRSFAFSKLEEACFVKGKMNRGAAIRNIMDETIEQFAESLEEEEHKYISELFEDMEKEIVRDSIFKRKVRTDSRGPEDIRPISCEVDILQRTHGSALFTRGETQSLATTTLGTVFDEKLYDDIDGEKRYENFMLHYNFPPFSVGETGRLSTGRREIGHGHLAQRAIEAILPDKNSFPYTIRIVSEILESNGSSSMASVCGGSLSLLNAGVPIEKPVAGIAMGLVKEGDDYVILSDILGEEDHLGDMDFKVAGTEDGITAFQMDIKISGVDEQLMKTALEQAKRGRMHILSKMAEAIGEPREKLSEYAPRIIGFKVDPDKIGLLIGPSGKTVKSISEKFNVNVNIEDNGGITIYCKNQEGAEKAKEAFMKLLEEPEIGKVYDGTVKRIVDFGAFIEFLPGKEGLCHISKMAPYRVKSVEDILSLNQEIPVRIIEIDKMGRVNLGLIYESDEEVEKQHTKPHSHKERDNRSGSHGRDHRSH